MWERSLSDIRSKCFKHITSAGLTVINLDRDKKADRREQTEVMGLLSPTV